MTEVKKTAAGGAISRRTALKGLAAAGATGAITFVGARQRSARSCFSVRCSSAALYCGAVPGL